MKVSEEEHAFVVRDFIFGKEWLRPADNLVRALRLFKPGYFARGPDWFCVNRESLIQREGRSEVLGLNACMIVEAGDDLVSLAVQEAANYRFELVELEPFKKFETELTAAIQKLATFPKLSLALSYYNASFGHKSRENQVIDLSVCLEALLLQKEDELTFRLAMRAANLLEADADSRKKRFTEIRDFYNLRSRIVHGEVLKHRETEMIQHVGRLRELVRRTMLSCIALGLEFGLASGSLDALDQMSFDDNLRRDIQRKASSFLYRHIEESKRGGAD